MAKQLREIQKENVRRKKLVADYDSEMPILKRAGHPN